MLVLNKIKEIVKNLLDNIFFVLVIVPIFTIGLIFYFWSGKGLLILLGMWVVFNIIHLLFFFEKGMPLKDKFVLLEKIWSILFSISYNKAVRNIIINYVSIKYLIIIIGLIIVNIIFTLYVSGGDDFYSSLFKGINVEWWGVITEIGLIYYVLDGLQRDRLKQQRVKDTETKLWEAMKSDKDLSVEDTLFKIRRLNLENVAPAILKNIDTFKFNSDDYEINNFKNTNVNNVNIENSILNNVNMQESSWYSLQINNSSFKGCNLIKAEFIDVSFTADKTLDMFEKCDFSTASFINVTFNNINIDEMKNLDKASFKNIKITGSFELPDKVKKVLEEKFNDQILIYDEDYVDGEDKIYRRLDNTKWIEKSGVFIPYIEEKEFNFESKREDFSFSINGILSNYGLYDSNLAEDILNDLISGDILKDDVGAKLRLAIGRGLLDEYALSKKQNALDIYNEIVGLRDEND